jgi:hypothetical protein
VGAASRGLPTAEALDGADGGGEGGVFQVPSSQHGSTSAEGGALPCQDSHNSTEGCTEGGSKPQEIPCFTSSAKRTALALQLNVQAMCERHGISQVGFLTLTFSEHITDPKEAQRRMNSLTTHVLRPRYGEVIRVIERQKSGRLHYHLLIALGHDIRTGVDFAALERCDYGSASPALRAEWKFWRDTAKKYGFGRTELLPIRSCTEAIGKYVGKYIAKHIVARQPQDKRVRLVSYSGPRMASTRFAWASPGAAEWRKKLGAFVHMMHEAGAIAEPTTKAMYVKFGPRWAYEWRDNIATFPLSAEKH